MKKKPGKRQHEAEKHWTMNCKRSKRESKRRAKWEDAQLKCKGDWEVINWEITRR